MDELSRFLQQFRPGHRRATGRKGPRNSPMRAFRLQQTFSRSLAGNHNAKIN
jgi:hypothetical protein